MKLVDLKLMAAEVADKQTEMAVNPSGQPDDYNWGLNFRLEQEELDKLGIDKPPGLGDEFHMLICAKVTSVNQQAGEEDECCVGLQIQMAVVLEHESADEEDAESAEDEAAEMKSLLSYFK